MAKKPTTSKAASKNVEGLKHDSARSKTIPTAEYQSVMQKNEQAPVRVAYPRDAAGLEDEKQQRNRDRRKASLRPTSTRQRHRP